jgi:hypothetical protein
MQIEIVYAIAAGIFWDTSRVLVTRGLANSDVSAATLVVAGILVLRWG